VKWRQMQYSVVDDLAALVRAERFDIVHATATRL